MEKPSPEVFEQLGLYDIDAVEPVQDTPEETVAEKIKATLKHFLPGVEVSYDEENDETVLRQHPVE